MRREEAVGQYRCAVRLPGKMFFFLGCRGEVGVCSLFLLGRSPFRRFKFLVAASCGCFFFLLVKLIFA